MSFSKIAVFIFIIFFEFGKSISFAQKRILPSYIIMLNGDTLKGEMEYGDFYATQNNIDFKTGNDNIFHHYSPKDILGFGIDSVADFISASVQLEVSSQKLDKLPKYPELNLKSVQIFLNKIVDGDLILYRYDDSENRSHFFISKKDSTPLELVFRKYINYSHINQYHSF